MRNRIHVVSLHGALMSSLPGGGTAPTSAERARMNCNKTCCGRHGTRDRDGGEVRMEDTPHWRRAAIMAGLDATPLEPKWLRIVLILILRYSININININNINITITININNNIIIIILIVI